MRRLQRVWSISRREYANGSVRFYFAHPAGPGGSGEAHRRSGFGRVARRIRRVQEKAGNQRGEDMGSANTHRAGAGGVLGYGGSAAHGAREIERQGGSWDGG